MQKHKQVIYLKPGWEMKEYLQLALPHAATPNINQFKRLLCVFIYLLNSLLSATI